MLILNENRNMWHVKQKILNWHSISLEHPTHPLLLTNGTSNDYQWNSILDTKCIKVICILSQCVYYPTAIRLERY